PRRRLPLPDPAAALLRTREPRARGRRRRRAPRLADRALASPRLAAARHRTRGDMKILCHVHTLNDEDVIDAAIQSTRAQRRRGDGIVLVDNASTDGTLARSFPPELTVIRHAINTGTCGSVH